MAANPGGGRDEYATKGDLRDVEQSLRTDIRRVDDRLTVVEKSIRHDIASLSRMVRLIMDHLGISEPSPPAR